MPKPNRYHVTGHRWTNGPGSAASEKLVHVEAYSAEDALFQARQTASRSTCGGGPIDDLYEVAPCQCVAADAERERIRTLLGAETSIPAVVPSMGEMLAGVRVTCLACGAPLPRTERIDRALSRVLTDPGEEE